MKRQRTSSSSHQDKRDTRRLFLALWPETTVREKMAALAATIQEGRRVAVEKLHLTLKFLGNTDDEQLTCLRQTLQDVQVPNEALILDRLGYWPRSRVLWLGASQTPASLKAFTEDLNRLLTPCGFESEKRPFRAHITLARKYPGPPTQLELVEPIVWQVNELVLVESVRQQDGMHYQVLQRWPED